MMTAPRTIFAMPDFRRLFAGVTTSQLGDQFALIATPWLVLQLTGDPLALGLVLALEGAPRALFMLLGGAITDRYSPRLVLIVADLIRLLLTTLMAALVLTGAIEMWMVYLFALFIGSVAGFAVPAGNAITPLIVADDDLQAGNAMIMGGSQVAGFVGPVAAGILIGTLTNTFVGVGTAFAVDAITFGFSGFMLLQIHFKPPATATAEETGKSLLSDVRDGLAHVWGSSVMRLTLIIIAAVNLLFIGPLMVGIPVLAEQRLAEGARAFGLLMSGFACGNLAGYVLAGALAKPTGEVIRVVLLGLLSGFAGTLAILGWSASTWLDFAVLLVLGLGNGYVTIVLISAVQSRTPKDLLGRVMGLFMFSSMGLVPVSQALSGAIIRWDTAALFMGAASLLTLVALWLVFQPALSAISGVMSDAHEDVQPAKGII